MDESKLERLANEADAKVTGGASDNFPWYIAHFLLRNKASVEETAGQFKRLGYDALNAYTGMSKALESITRRIVYPNLDVVSALDSSGYEKRMILKAVWNHNIMKKQKQIKYGKKILAHLGCDENEQRELLSSFNL